MTKFLLNINEDNMSDGISQKPHLHLPIRTINFLKLQATQAKDDKEKEMYEYAAIFLEKSIDDLR
jgi:hypothetical protein